MNVNYKRVPTRFAPDTRFELAPVGSFRAVQEDRFERLKNRLLEERLTEAPDPQTYSALRRAANEAAVMAWTTAFPLLVFPGLFEEKAHVALRHEQRQENTRERSRALLVL